MQKPSCFAVFFALTRALCCIALVQPSLAIAGSLDTWYPRSAPQTNANICGIAYGNGRFVVFTDTSNRIFTSTNGADWEMHLSPYPNFKTLAFGNGVFLAAFDTYSSATRRIYSSPDGATWTFRLAGATSAMDFRTIQFGNGVYAVLGSSVLLSTDLINWSTPVYETASFYDVAFGNGVFAAVESGAPGSVLSCTDGANWTYRRIGVGSEHYSQIAFGNGKFVTVAYPSFKSLTSTDGLNWTLNPTTNVVSGFITGVAAFGGGYFLCLPISGSTLLASTNGADWETHSFGTNWTPYAIAYGNNTFVAVGNAGIILQSGTIASPLPPPPPPSIAMTHAGTLVLTGETGYQCRIEYTNDLSPTNIFQPLVTFSLDSSPCQWTDPNAGTVPRRFYRAVLFQ